MWYSPGLESSQDSLRKTTCHCLKTIAASTSQTFALWRGPVFLHHWRPFFLKPQILELRQLQTSCTRSSAIKWFSLALQQSFARKSTLAAAKAIWRFAKTMPTNVCWSPYSLLYKMKWQGTWSIEFWSHTIREFWKPLERICAASKTWTLEVSQVPAEKFPFLEGR